jgi:O-antigen ligase
MTATHASPTWDWRREWRWLLVISYLVLLPTKALWNYPILALAVVGVIALARGKLLADPTLKRATCLCAIAFAALWLPMVASLPGAVEASHSGPTTAKYLRFLFAALGIAYLLHEERERHRLTACVALILGVWCLDAFWQVASGITVLGEPVNPRRIQGVFYPRYRLGVGLAVMTPLVLECVRQLALRRKTVGQQLWVGLLALPLPAVVLLSGSRSAWLMLIGAAVLYGVWLAFGVLHKRSRWRALGAMVLLAIVVIAGALSSDGFRERLSASTGVFSGDFESADKATSYRLSIWKPAVDMWQANPVTGIGPRGYRYAFEDYASADNFWMLRHERGATHPHHQWIEIAAETGTVGLVGLLVFLLTVGKLGRNAIRGVDGLAVGWIACALLAVWPTNVHSAIYSGFWATVLWWITAIAIISACAGLKPTANRTAP